MGLYAGRKIVITGEKLVYRGDCISRFEGVVVFVPHLIPGEKAKVVVTKKTSSYAVAEIIKILAPSKNRVIPPCRYHYNLSAGRNDYCGGCCWQHISYDCQLYWKKRIFIESLGPLKSNISEDVDIVGLEPCWGFRHKIQMPVEASSKSVKSGFYKPYTHRVVDIDKCIIQNEAGNKIYSVAKGLLRKSRKVFVRGLKHILIRVNSSSKEALVCFITKTREFHDRNALTNKIKEQLPLVKGIFQNINPADTNVILGKKTIKLWGADFIRDSIGNVVYNVSPISFFQTNPRQTIKLYDYVKRLVSGYDCVLDLYSGSGGMGLYLAGSVKTVYGIEENYESVRNAEGSALASKTGNCVFLLGSVEEKIFDLAGRLSNKKCRAAAIINPPRSGCSESFLKTLSKIKINELIYVSCNPTTLVRDLKILVSAYKISDMRIFDMFPHSYHLESVVRLAKKC